ncbi:MAG: hypothetical protein DPW09_14970 [Anaerolineae bacterium]|nr:tyrosine-type recombinase/integrase [Anaerolineales bacterium]MCQ3974741.1 hypothetical protein [Anaerolineae bacterium]
MTALGLAAGVAEVTPHRLRHSLATRLLNAGMDITRIQKLLGHTQLSTTQVYAQVLDLTLEADYRRAMTKIELRSRPLSNQPVAVDHWPVRSELKSLVSAEIETRPLRENLSQMAD